MKSLLLFLLLTSGATLTYSQGVVVSGSIHQANDTTGIPGAAIRMERLSGISADSVIVSVTDAKGRFRFEKVPFGKYMIRIEFLGFKPYSSTVQVEEQALDLGKLFLREESLLLEGVQVSGRIPLGKQIDDTTQFNAGAFKTTPNSSAGRLIQKMPGITIQDGQMQAQGEVIQEILVDGKPFFEGDVEGALKSLPADIIQHIQVFDKQSDQAAFSGFDDGERAKTINIVTKPDRRRGFFGQASAGYGTGDKYLAGAALNFFQDERRVTITGITNDINTSDYSIGETPGGGLDGDSEGNTTTNSISVNYNDEWGGKIEVSGNYSFDHRQDLNLQHRFREYILPSDSGQVYTEEDRGEDREAGHRLRMRLEYDIDDNNELVVEPHLSVDQNKDISRFFGRTVNDFGPINQSKSNSTSDHSGLEFENELYYRHRFGKKGRTLSASMETDVNSGKGEIFRVADNVFYSGDNPEETLDQYINPYSRELSWEGNLSYTEPVGDSARMEMEYTAGNSRDKSDRRAFNLAAQTGEYTLLDTLLSNTFESEYITQEFEVGYQYSTKKLNVEIEAEYEQASLQNDQLFPKAYDMERTFHSLLPSVEVEYRFTKSRNLRLDYRTGTNAPSLEDLQDVIDNSNPLHLSTGNPDLRQSYQNELSLRYKSFDPETNKVFYARVEGSMTRNPITNSTIIAREPIPLSDDVVLERGAQLTRPVNLEESNWDVRTRFSYGQPVSLIASNLELHGAVGYSSRPGMINEEVNFSRSGNFRMGASLSSNISEKIDFNISTRSSYSIVENTLRPQQNSNYFNQSSRLRGTLIFWKGIVLRAELDHQVNAGLSSGYDNKYLLWNMSISKLLFSKKRGEICLSVNDLLKQNNNIDRNVTELYIEDERSNILQRFFILSFTYNIRHFAAGR